MAERKRGLADIDELCRVYVSLCQCQGQLGYQQVDISCRYATDVNGKILTNGNGAKV